MKAQFSFFLLLLGLLSACGGEKADQSPKNEVAEPLTSTEIPADSTFKVKEVV